MTIDIGLWRKKSSNHLTGISGDAGVEVLALLKNVLNKDTVWILTNPEYILSGKELELLNIQFERLCQGEPLAYITNQTDFFDSRFYIENSVLIPRPETELLVEKALKWCKTQSKTITFIDVGTGSGIIGLSILKHFPDNLGFGIDISFGALRIAQKNKESLNIESFNLVQADLISIIKNKIDLVCANLPYIPSIPLQQLRVSKYEPKIALDGGQTGVEIIYRLISQLDGRVNSPGLILLEIQFDQGEKVTQYAKEIFPGADIKIIKDLSGNDRVVSIEI